MLVYCQYGNVQSMQALYLPEAACCLSAKIRLDLSPDQTVFVHRSCICIPGCIYTPILYLYTRLYLYTEAVLVRQTVCVHRGCICTPTYIYTQRLYLNTRLYLYTEAARRRMESAGLSGSTGRTTNSAVVEGNLPWLASSLPCLESVYGQ